MKNSLDVVVPEGSFYAYVAVPKKLPAPAVVVIQEAFGVNADIRQTCDELAELGFIAASPDLYWRQEPMVQLSATKEWDKAMEFYNALDLDKAVKDVHATAAKLRELSECTGKVGIMGFCLGALLTYLTSVRGGLEAGVCYYGGRTAEFLDEADKLQGPLMMHLGTLDEFISPTDQSAIKKALEPKGVTIYSYEGCSHAFARHRGLHFDPGAAAKANGRTHEFLKTHLA